MDLKESLSFSQGQLDTTMKSIQELEEKISFRESTLSKIQENLVACEDNIEYLENMSRRNNVKLIGIPENESETWDESEEILKSQVKSALKIPEDLDIERAHRVLHDLLSNSSVKDKQVYILGDFNIDLLNYDSHISTGNFVSLFLSLSTFFLTLFIPQGSLINLQLL